MNCPLFSSTNMHFSKTYAFTCTKHTFLCLFFKTHRFYNELYTVRLGAILRPFWHRAEPVAEQSRAEPSRAGPSRAEPRRARAEPSRAEPGRAELPQASPSRAEPNRADSSRKVPNRAETSRAGGHPRARFVQKQQFLQRILSFYTLFKNISVYNEFDYFAIQTRLPST